MFGASSPRQSTELSVRPYSSPETNLVLINNHDNVKMAQKITFNQQFFLFAQCFLEPILHLWQANIFLLHKLANTRKPQFYPILVSNAFLEYFGMKSDVPSIIFTQKRTEKLILFLLFYRYAHT